MQGRSACEPDGFLLNQTGNSRTYEFECAYNVTKKGPETGPFLSELVPTTEYATGWLEHGFVVPLG